MWTESGPRANTSLGNAPADVSAVPSRGPNRGHPLSRMSVLRDAAQTRTDQPGTGRHRRRLTFRQMPLAEPSPQSMTRRQRSRASRPTSGSDLSRRRVGLASVLGSLRPDGA
jgi:hypothetical protein